MSLIVAGGGRANGLGLSLIVAGGGRANGLGLSLIVAGGGRANGLGLSLIVAGEEEFAATRNSWHVHVHPDRWSRSGHLEDRTTGGRRDDCGREGGWLCHCLLCVSVCLQLCLWLGVSW